MSVSNDVAADATAPDLFPMSFGQERLWLLEQLEPGTPLYSVPQALRLDGPLDRDVLSGSIVDLCQRHEALRTTFPVIDGIAMQAIAFESDVTLEFVDASAYDAAERAQRLEELLAAECARAFDLARGPLFRALLVRLGHERHVLLLNFHHIIVDEGSIEIVERELGTLYAARASGTVAGLPPLAIQYADFAAWQREGVTSVRSERDLYYWRDQLAGAPQRMQLPERRSSASASTQAGGYETLVLQKAIGAAVDDVSLRYGSTFFMVLLAAFNVLLHRYTGERDIVIGTPISNRGRSELEGVVGFFGNTVALRTRWSGDPSFAELLADVRDVALSAYEHQQIPFERLVENLQPQRVASRTPFASVMFVAGRARTQRFHVPGVVASDLKLPRTTAKFDLTLSVTIDPDGPVCSIEYRRDLFEAETIVRMLGHFANVLAAVVRDPDAPIATIPLLLDTERRRVLDAWSGRVEAARDHRCIHELFEAHVRAAPHAVAVVAGDRRLTYDALNRRANRLARTLRALGVGPGSHVGVCAERSPESTVAFLAILKAGGAYVPLDADYPQARLRFILDDARVEIVLAQRALARRISGEGVRTIVVADADDLPGTDDGDLEAPPTITPDDTAYVIYTSGSSGEPKGVLVPHRAVVRLVRDTNYVEIAKTDAIAHASTLSFDAATFEIWGALLNGARSIVVLKDVLLDPNLLSATIVRHRIDVMFVTTALFHHVAVRAPATFRALRLLLVGGETLAASSVRRVVDAGAPTELVNVYGPTEATTFATYHVIAQSAPPEEAMPIGRPIANTRAYVLDARLVPVPIGAPGELYLGGPGLARGYLNDPDLTARRFVRDPFSSDPRARLYATSDRVRFSPLGELEFIGRIDTQIKLRGYRIELAEIEIALRRCPGVADALVVLRADAAGENRLIAYIVPEPDRIDEPERIESLLRDRLPAFMLPRAIVAVDAFPLSPNGKVATALLPPPPSDLPTLPHLEPTNVLQRKLVAMWETILDHRPVGVRDNFFDLGGHSLLAARLFSDIEVAFGKRPPLGAFFTDPTIEHLASQLAEDDVATSLTSYNSDGSATPLFFLHGDLHGTGMYCAKLARALGSDQPFFVFEPHGTGATPLVPTIEAMAEQYVAHVRRIAPHGPYRLGGFCSGGLVAFEMASQLAADGETISRLILVDSPAHNAALAALAATIEFIRVRLDAAGSERLLAWSGRMARAYGVIRRFVAQPRKMAKIRSIVARFRARSGGRVASGDLLGAWVRISERYVPRPYSGVISLLVTQDGVRTSAAVAGWRAVSKRTRVRAIPGRHLTSVTTHAGEFAEALRATLDQASSGA